MDATINGGDTQSSRLSIGDILNDHQEADAVVGASADPAAYQAPSPGPIDSHFSENSRTLHSRAMQPGMGDTPLTKGRYIYDHVPQDPRPPKRTKHAPMTKQQQNQAIANLEQQILRFQAAPPAKTFQQADRGAFANGQHNTISGIRNDPLITQHGGSAPVMSDSLMHGRDILENVSAIEQHLLGFGQTRPDPISWPAAEPQHVLDSAPFLQANDTFADHWQPDSASWSTMNAGESRLSIEASQAKIAAPEEQNHQDRRTSLPSMQPDKDLSTGNTDNAKKAISKRKIVNRRARKDQIAAKLSKAQGIVDMLAHLGTPFEQSVDELAYEGGNALLMSIEGGSAAEELMGMAAEWKASNREHFTKLASFLERNAVLPVGGVELPKGELQVGKGNDSVMGDVEIIEE